MKTLFLLRHAKSSWGDANLSDFERPLNERGLQSAPLMGEVFKKNNFQTDLILSSPATRAAQTAELFKKAANINDEIEFESRIYEARPSQLLEIISEQRDDLNSILLVGHNPGLENLVRILTGEIQPMPTAALAVINLEIESWRNINAVNGELKILIRPKEIV